MATADVALQRRARRRARPLARWRLALAAIAVVALGAWGWQRLHPAVDPTAGLLTAPVQRGDLVETVSATGSVAAQTGEQVKIGSQITGRIRRLYADVGSQVKAGQIIAQLDLPDVEAQLLQAQANLQAARTKLAQQQSGVGMERVQLSSAVSQAQAQLRTAQAQLAQAQAGANLQVASAQEQANQTHATAANTAMNLSRQLDLYKQGFIAAADVDTAKTSNAVSQSQAKAAAQNVDLVRQKVAADVQNARDQVAQAQAAVRTAQANTSGNVLKQQDIAQAREAVQAARAQVAYSQAQLDKAVIRSPIDGTVLQLAVQQGETLAAGLSAPTLIVVANLDRLQVDAYVDETDIGKVRIGQPASVTVDAFPRRPFDGVVTKIASGSTIQQGVVTYDVTIAVHDDRHRLKPDMTASVTIQTGTRSSVLLVPSEAVKLSARGATVNVVEKKDGKSVVVPRRVRTGGSDGTNTEIRQGLQEGEVVVLAGLDNGGQGRRAGASPFGPGGGGGGGRRGG